ncbi:hypothetical protein E2320_015815 [Naja naja]|nr:hypothetical protein E2320_015815 [Naja naja]
MEAAATKDKMAVHPNDTEKPKSCREKFLQAWNEKLKLQPCPILYSQTLASQSVVDISVQEKRTRNNKALSDLKTRASLQHNENAIYFVKVMPLPPKQMHPTPGGVYVHEHCPQQDAVASWHSNHDATDKKVPSGSMTNVEEELLQICVSDLLMESPARKRPRLLPPHRKMHVEVWKKEASPALQEQARNPVPLAYNHLVDTMSMTNLADLPEVESFYRRFNPKLKQSCDRKNSPIQSGADGFLLVRNTDVSTTQEAVGKIAKQHQQLSSKRSSPLPDLMVANIESMNSQNIHLPPKKRYTHGCL